jgi:hypothetical protein
MKYTAFALILGGAGTACFAAYLYAGGPPGRAEGPSPAGVAILLGFAAALVGVGAAMWAFGGKGYTVSGPPAARPAGGPYGSLAPRTGTRPMSWSGDLPHQSNGGVEASRHDNPG